MSKLRFLLAICGLLSLPSVVSAQFTRSGSYWVPNQMISNLPPQVLHTYYPNTRPNIAWQANMPPAGDIVDNCRVLSVVDGDTIKVLANGFICDVRLRDIDAPEADQEYGPEAKRALETLLGRDFVKVAWRERDKYGRFVGTVYLNDQDINLKMVRFGWAWSYGSQGQNAVYDSVERDAKASRAGLWISADPVPPWIFRQM